MDCGDIDRDGLEEVVSCDSARRSRVLDYTGGSYVLAYNTSQTPTATAGVRSCNVVDMTNDGFDDFADVSNRNDGVRIFSYNASSSCYYSLWNVSGFGATASS